MDRIIEILNDRNYTERGLIDNVNTSLKYLTNWLNGIGAVIGAPLVAASMDIFGDWAYFSLIGFIHLGLAIFVGYRMTVRPAIPAEAQGPLVLLPDTSTATAVSLNPETEWIDNSPDALAEADPLEDNPYFP